MLGVGVLFSKREAIVQHGRYGIYDGNTSRGGMAYTS